MSEDKIADYSFLIASDLDRDGLGVEMLYNNHIFAEVFYSDVTDKMTVSLAKSDLPIEAVEKLLETAKERLPPAQRRTILGTYTRLP